MARLDVLGVPSSAGAYCVGVELAPAALRDAGLVEALTSAGHQVHDAGDLTTRRWRPDRDRPLAQNLDDEVASVQETAARAAELLTGGGRLLLLGGSCTVAVGLCAALAAEGHPPRLVYVDRHLDLNTPSSTTEGSLSWMGMAHALDLDGAAPELARVAGGEGPLLRPTDLVYLGVGGSEATEAEHGHVRRLGITVVGQDRLVADPTAAAAEARSALPRGPFAVHVDVDVLDFLDAPLAENVNGRNSGPTIGQLGQALRELWRQPECRALSVGQLVPAHAASDPEVLPRFVRTLAAALTPEP